MFIQEELEYPFDALEPSIDRETMEIHFTKHHAGYVAKLNDSLKEFDSLQNLSIEELLGSIEKLPELVQDSVRNNGGGHSNHSLFWTSMATNGSESDLMNGLMAEKFGSMDVVKDLFSDFALTRFGSGWAWLVQNGDEFEIYTTPNQDSPLMEGKNPLLGLDLWEHAYYLKYQNRRAEYIENWWSVVNWIEVERRLG